MARAGGRDRGIFERFRKTTKAGVDVRVSMGWRIRYVGTDSLAVQLFKEQLASHESEWVFPSKTGETSLDGDNFYHRVWRPALKRAKIKNLRIHDLRHTFCSRLVERGAGLRTVQVLAGHKSFSTTERYAHLAPDHLREAVETFVSGPPRRMEA